jgi:hypothetical protein
MPNPFLQIAGAIPFSSFGGENNNTRKRRKNNNTSKRRRNNNTSKRKRNNTRRRNNNTRKRNNNTRKRRRNNNTRKRRRNNNTGKKRSCRGLQKGSPDMLGYCSKKTPNNVVMKGADGNLWENKNHKWVMVRKDMRGGFIRSGTI